MNRTVALDLPEELIATIGSAEDTAVMAKEALVFELLREGRLGQSRVGELLGISRWEVLRRMGRYGIDQGPRSPEELGADVEAAERAAGS